MKHIQLATKGEMPQSKEHTLGIKQSMDHHEGGVPSHATKVFNG
jgi:hypothetical protein